MSFSIPLRTPNRNVLTRQDGSVDWLPGSKESFRADSCRNLDNKDHRESTPVSLTQSIHTLLRRLESEHGIELLYTPEECIRFKHPAFDLIRPEVFLSKLCRQSFGNYAMGQIRKARGLNKKIVNPEPRKRRHLRDFCHILEGQGYEDLLEIAGEKHLEMEAAFDSSSLPETPSREQANDILLAVRDAFGTGIR